MKLSHIYLEAMAKLDELLKENIDFEEIGSLQKKMALAWNSMNDLQRLEIQARLKRCKPQDLVKIRDKPRVPLGTSHRKVGV